MQKFNTLTCQGILNNEEETYRHWKNEVIFISILISYS